MKTTSPSFPLILKSTYGWILVPANGINCINAEDKYARLTYADGSTVVLFHSMNDLESRLACGTRVHQLLFLRTHRTCIVAMHHARALHGKEQVELDGGAIAPVSRKAWAVILRLLGSVHSTKSALRAA
ncbi:MAG TPA: LytTR family DNA-binding domain-containing protein [Flavobacteriales bacterium]|nr:LytTR family DNA-binding domain-containing protein [Flavobacteriales bacterium]